MHLLQSMIKLANYLIILSVWKCSFFFCCSDSCFHLAGRNTRLEELSLCNVVLLLLNSPGTDKLTLNHHYEQVTKKNIPILFM